jgi:hypothetical protein
MKGDQKVLAGVGLLVVAVIIAVVIASSGGGGGDRDGGGGSGGTAGDVSCTLGTSGVGLIAAGLSRRESAGAIIAGIAATTAVGVACKKAINSFVSTPEQSVPLQIEAPNGTTVEQTPTGSELAQPPPQQPANRPNSLDCFRYNSGFVIRLCLNGTIPPPSG